MFNGTVTERIGERSYTVYRIGKGAASLEGPTDNPGESALPRRNPFKFYQRKYLSGVSGIVYKQILSRTSRWLRGEKTRGGAGAEIIEREKKVLQGVPRAFLLKLKHATIIYFYFFIFIRVKL